MSKVRISKRARKVLDTLAPHLARAFFRWAEAVEAYGIETVQQNKGYHDEPLKGPRAGERSIRLNRSWRAIYTVHNDGIVEFLLVEEITHHEY